jgi:apolipoprotein N-acyltransferase
MTKRPLGWATISYSFLLAPGSYVLFLGSAAVLVMAGVGFIQTLTFRQSIAGLVMAGVAALLIANVLRDGLFSSAIDREAVDVGGLVLLLLPWAALYLAYERAGHLEHRRGAAQQEQVDQRLEQTEQRLRRIEQRQKQVDQRAARAAERTDRTVTRSGIEAVCKHILLGALVLLSLGSLLPKRPDRK